MHNHYPDNPECGVRLDARLDQTGASLDLAPNLHRGTASLWIRGSDGDSARVYLDLADLVALRNGINHIIDQEIT